MPYKEGLELERVTVRIFKGDKERLENYYAASGYNMAIRNLVRAHLRNLDEKATQAAAEIEEEL